MKKSETKKIKEIEKQIDERYRDGAIKLYNYIKHGSLTDPITGMVVLSEGRGIDRGVFTTWTLERKKEVLDELISCFKEMGDDDKVKYLERELILLTEGGGEFDSGGSGKCVIRLVSIQTVGDVESWGHDGHYYHDIVVAIPDKILDEDEKFVLEKIAKGEFVLEGKIWCSELEDPLSKSNIMKVALSSSSLDEFANDVMEDMYTALVGWCRSKWPKLKEREIFEIARAISEPMFGGESMDSESSIDFIDCDYEEPEKFEAPKEDKKETDEDIINELFRRAFAASTPKGDWDEMLDKADVDKEGKKIIPFEDYKCPKNVMNKIFDDVMKEFNVSDVGRKSFKVIFWMGPSPRN